MPSNHPGHDVAVGQARHADASTAARLAARQALDQLRLTPHCYRQPNPDPAREPAQKPAWLLAFAGGQHDPAAILEGLRAELGPLPVIGGSGTGIITAQGAHSSGYECGLMLFSQALAPAAIIRVAGLEVDEAAAGRALGQQLNALALGPERLVLLFYDSVNNKTCPPSLHLCSRLLDGLHQTLGTDPPLILGAGTLTDLEMSDSYLFDGEGMTRHTAVAVVLPAGLRGHNTIMHGCLPSSDFLEVTRIDGARLLEIDGQPALRVVEERLRLTREELLARQPLPSITIGEKHGDLYAPFNDDQYVNRLVVAIDPTEEALILTEADFHPGSRIQIMSYAPERMIASAQTQTEALRERLTGLQPVFALYIDCAGRSMAFAGLDEDESAPVRELIGALCPLLGFYSGIEIAPFIGRARPLDWTGVLLVCTAGAPTSSGQTTAN
ncbi:FIST signal transduction protein [Thiorhodovibrio winogradskyi]|nr:FIST N-terminal domain-containing protein [Thiorhodovibrio winogradskyi]